VKTFLIILFFPLLSYSQNSSEGDSVLMDLTVVDTNLYNGKKIFVFNDGSWEYEGEFKIISTYKASVENGILKLDQDEWYKKDWKNFKTFSYSYNGLKMMDSLKLNIEGAVKPSSAACNSGFKIRWGRWHCGNDFACNVGSEVKSVWGGKVRYAQFNNGGYGNLVIIRHPNGLETYYAHLSSINVKVNEEVLAGSLIGKSGNTGHSKGPHLHFEVRFLDNPIDPQLIFNQKELLIHAGIFKVSNSGTSFYASKVFTLVGEGGQGSQSTMIQKSVKRRRTVSNMGG